MSKKPIDIEQLIADKLSGAILPEEEKLLEDILATDPVARELWEDTVLALDCYRSAKLAKSIPVAQRFDELMARFAEETLPATSVPKRRKALLIWIKSAAAAIFLIVFVGWLFWQREKATLVMAGNTGSDSVFLSFDDGQHIKLTDDRAVNIGNLTFSALAGNLSSTPHVQANTSMVTVNVPKGKSYQLFLPDGTHVRLNADSKLKFPASFPDSTREIHLSGEAFFDVRKNPGSPFIVFAGNLKTQVLGTSFNIKSYENEPVQASVVTGKVSTAASALASGGLVNLQLTAGQAAVMQSDGSLAKVSFDADEVLGWIHGRYFFSNERLDRIMAAVNRMAGYKVTITTGAEAKFSGAYEKDKPIAFLLDRITASSDIRYRIAGNHITLY